MSELIFLGAGASNEAGVPLSFQMSHELAKLMDVTAPYAIINSYRDACPPEPYCRAFHFVLGGLLARRGTQGHNPFDGVDVEELFNAIEALGQRDALEVSPFITDWNKSIDEMEQISPDEGEYYAEQLWRQIDESFELFQDCIKQGYKLDAGLKRRRAQQKADFVSSFTDAVGTISGVVHRPWIFGTTLEIMMRLLWRMVWITKPRKVMYLEPLLSYCKKRGVTIVSINYDNAIELCGQNLNVPVDTGMVGWQKTGSVVFDPDAVTLLKLHGSVDWQLTGFCPTEDKPAPEMALLLNKISEPENDFKFRPAVIFGHRNKLTAEGPFLQLLRSFEERLDNCVLLTVIGYSFRDAHINALICHWLNGDRNRKIQIINGSACKLETLPIFTSRHADYLKERLENKCVKASKGIQQLFAKS